MADQRFIGGDRRYRRAKHSPEGIKFDLVADPGGGGVTIDCGNILRNNSRITNGILHALSDCGKMGGDKMVGIRGHPPAGQFGGKGQAVAFGKFPAGQNDGPGPFREDKAAPIGGKRAAGCLRRALFLALLGDKDAIHGVKTGDDRFHQGKINGPADHHIGSILGQEHGPDKHGGQSRGTGRDSGDDGSLRPGLDGNLAAHHIDTGVGIGVWGREFVL